jgi:thiol-disulfide isomerase/thioredoxin
MAKKKESPKASKSKSTGKKDDAVMEINVPDSSFMVPAAILISAVIVAIAIIYTGSDGGTSGKTANDEQGNAQTEGSADDSIAQNTNTPAVLGELQTFTEYDSDICKEDGKPVVYLFSTTWCPHCTWISDTFDSWAKANSDKITAYHWELDTNDNTLTEAVETEVPSDHNSVYETFNPNGSIPTFVFGCRYGRVGNGFESEDDLEKEKAAFDAIVKEII